MENNLQLCLKTNWGHERFRPYQLEVIEASLAGRDTFVLMATGSGKSVCYQLPAVLQRRGQTGPVTMVVSPLISLMEDQVLSLKNNGISACLVGGSSDMGTENRAVAGEFPLVFVTPEKISNWGHSLRTMEAGPGLALFAVDESHCVAEWGHDFRPSYLELRSLREKFPKVPIMALTATATPRVESEIMSNLGLRNPFVAKTSFNRWNLHYSVKPTTAQARPLALSALLKGVDGSAIIYVMTKKEAEQTTADVVRILGSKGAKTYHGGMSHGERRAVHHAFIRDEVQVVVATLAFGMGIDKPDVRLVIHCGMPKTVEAYYQQTGRAGRDGLPANCVLLFSRADAIRQRSIMSMSTNGIAPSATTIQRSNDLLAEMEKFATGPGCRRRALLMYFGEDMGNAKCDGCDACDRAAAATVVSAAGIAKSKEDIELFTEPARLMLQAVQDSGGRYGFAVPISLLMGTKNAQNRLYNATSKPSFGKGKERGKNESFWKALFHQLVEREGFIRSVSFSSDFGGRSGVTYCLADEGRKFLGNANAKLPPSFTPSDELAAEGRRLKSIASTPAEQQQSQSARLGSNTGLSEDELKVHGLLFKLRSDIATSQGIPPYNVLGGQVLRKLAQRRPVDLAALATVEGMSDKKVADYGSDIVKVVSEACNEFKLQGNVPAKAQPSQEGAWLTSRRSEKPLTSTQFAVHGEYTRKGSLSLEQVAAGMIRPLSVGVFIGHLAACLEGGRPFEWDRRRLGIDQALEDKVLGVLDYLQKEGHKPLATGFRLKPIFEELPPDTDKSAYNTIKLILARLRFESGGRRLPGSGGEIMVIRPNVSPSVGKKRSLPSWGGASSANPSTNKPRTTAAPSTTSPAPLRLFTPSYEASPSSGTRKVSPAVVDVFTPSYESPPSSGTGKASPAVGDLFTPSYESPPSSGTGKVSPAAVDLFTPSYEASRSSGTGKVSPAVVDLAASSKSWTSEVVLRAIKEAGPFGATIKDMLVSNPGNEQSLRGLLSSLQEDFLIFTKPADGEGGEAQYLIL